MCASTERKSNDPRGSVLQMPNTSQLRLELSMSRLPREEIIDVLTQIHFHIPMRLNKLSYVIIPYERTLDEI